MLDAVLIALERAAGSPAFDFVDLITLGCCLAQAQASGCYLAMGTSGLWLRGVAWLTLCGLASTANPFVGGFSFAVILTHSLVTAAPLVYLRIRGWNWAGTQHAETRRGQYQLGQLFALTFLIAILSAAFRWEAANAGLFFASVQFLLFVPLGCGLFVAVFRDWPLFAIFSLYLILAGFPSLVLAIPSGTFSMRALLIGLMDGAVLLAVFGLVRACGYRLERAPSANQPPR